MLEDSDIDYQGWRELAERWADVLATRYRDAADPTPEMATARTAINARFRAWLDAHYHELASLPSVPTPAMVHRTPHAMESRLGDGPLALIVIDGLSLALWRALEPLVRDPGECERWDSNPHALRHGILSPARLPIPPLPRTGGTYSTGGGKALERWNGERWTVDGGRWTENGGRRNGEGGANRISARAPFTVPR